MKPVWNARRNPVDPLIQIAGGATRPGIPEKESLARRDCRNAQVLLSGSPVES